tara:strand:- start:56889 stop:57749 length:861 start_codon:yes stop_codon:yes gene_type:complete
MSTEVKTFFDPTTFTLTYIVYDEASKDGVVIDPVLDYDPAASKVEKHSLAKVVDFVKDQDLKIHYILDTHAHADHLTGAAELKKAFPNALIGIGEKIKLVQSKFSEIYNLKDFNINGVQFDRLYKDGEKFNAGSLEIEVIHTPGHTPACVSYHIDQNVFTGDALFMPDYGTGRCDFPMGSAKELYHSIHEKLYKLPDETNVYVGHDYQPNGRALEFKSTIKTNKEKNIHIKAQTTEAEFVEFREKRDATLSPPRLLLPSIQVNIDGGKLPIEEDNGKRYLKIPIGD